MATTRPPGILAFGSTDPSVLLQCSLTSSAAVVAAGGTDLGNNTFDSTLGMKANGVTAATAGARFIGITGYASLDMAGQISFEIETTALAITSAAGLGNSTGAGWASTAHVLTCLSAASPTDYFRIAMTSGEVLFASHVVGSATKGTNPNTTTGLGITSFGKDRFCRITYSWLGQNYSLYVDGTLIYQGNSGGARPPNFCNRINIFSPEGLGNSAMSGYYARNLIVSNQPVMFSTHPLLGSLAFVGHSFVDTRCKTWDWTVATNGYGYDQSIAMQMRRYMNSYGFDANIPTDNSLCFGSSGAYIYGTAPLISTKVALCAAANPSAVVYIGGTNDVISATFATDRANIVAQLKNDMTTLLAASNTKRVVLANVTSVKYSTSYAVSGNDANVLALNADIAAIPAWWDAANPSRAGAIKVADVFTQTGGTAPYFEVFWGSVRGSNSDAHPTSYGNKIFGRVFAETLLSMLK